MRKFISLCLLVSSLHAAVEKRIGCHLLGGLGNQLFQAATTLSFAWDHNLKPVFFHQLDTPSREVARGTYWPTVFHNLHPKPLQSRIGYIQFTHAGTEFKPLKMKGSKTILWGYFQHLNYFHHHRDQLLEIFSLPKRESERVSSLLEQIRGKGPLVSIHFRRGDKVQFPDSNDINLWEPRFIDYYKRAMARFGSDVTYVVFSESPSWCKKHLGDLFEGKNVQYVNEPDYIEFFMMSRCDHHIIANSTFSWWAAYLNPSRKKRVILPKEWTLLKENMYPWGLFVPGWEILSLGI